MWWCPRQLVIKTTRTGGWCGGGAADTVIVQTQQITGLPGSEAERIRNCGRRKSPRPQLRVSRSKGATLDPRGVQPNWPPLYEPFASGVRRGTGHEVLSAAR